MTIHVRILDLVTGIALAELQPETITVTRRQDESGEWSFTAPVFMANARQLENYARAYIYEDGFLRVDGIVTSVQRAITEDGAKYNVSGSTELYDLSCIRAKSDAHYQDIQVISIVADLLTLAPGWGIGSLLTMIDPTVRTTLDLRSEKTLLPQIRKALDSVPGCHFRYGGVDPVSGDRLIDIGLFGEASGHLYNQRDHAEASRNLLRSSDGMIEGNITLSVDRGEVLRGIEAFGGSWTDDSGEERRISLFHALQYNPGLAVDPDFPILTIGSTYVVVNTALWPALGCDKREDYELNVTENSTTPTDAEVRQAGYAVWENAVSELREHAGPEEVYDFVVVGIGAWPQVGDSARVIGTAREGIEEPVTVNDDLRLIEHTWTAQGDTVIHTFKATTGEAIPPSMSSVSLFDVLDKPRRKIGSGISAAIQSIVAQGSSGLIGPGLASNCMQDSGILGRSIVVPLPPPPAWATSVVLAGMPWSNPNNHVIEIDQLPALPVQGLAVCVSGVNGINWDALSGPVEIFATFLFS